MSSKLRNNHEWLQNLIDLQENENKNQSPFPSDVATCPIPTLVIYNRQTLVQFKYGTLRIEN